MMNGKKVCKVSFIILVLCCTFLINTVASEYNPQNTAKADKLKVVRLFKGTDIGYELDKELTRAEGAVMVLRLFGLEKSAGENVVEASVDTSLVQNFIDVDDTHWAHKYINFASLKGFVRGTGNGRYTPERELTAKEFTTLILRCLGYSEAEPNGAFKLSQTSGLMTSMEVEYLENKETFLRDDMIQIAFKATQTLVKGTSKNLMQRLVEDLKVISEKEAIESGLYQQSSMMDVIERAVIEKIWNTD